MLEAVIYTMEETPQRLVIQGRDLYNYIHNYGTTGILTEVTIPLSPRTEWAQVIVSFDTLLESTRFGEALARGVHPEASYCADGMADSILFCSICQGDQSWQGGCYA